MKNSLFLLLIGLFFYSNKIFSQCVAPDVTSTWGSEYLSNVTFNTINNNSGNSDSYEDYTAQSTNLTAGQTYSFSGTVTGGSSYNIWVWCDWDGDNIFDHPSEFTDIGNGTGILSQNITVPASASIGSTTMRVILWYTDGPANDACGSTDDINYGETEDYTLNIVAGCNFPTTTMTQTCFQPSITSYTVEIDVTNLGDASSIDITDGTTTYETNVGIGTYTISGLTTGTTIYVQDNADATCNYSEAFTICDICTDAPSLPEDDCSNAPLIDLSQPFVGSTNCSYTAGPDPDAGSYCGNINNDSWITFIAGSTDVEMEYDVGTCSGSNTGIQLSVYSGNNCSSLTEVAGSCLNQAPAESVGSWTFSGLTIGDTYYIWIDGYARQLCDYAFTPISGVVITPPNDSCFEATSLICGASDTASNILATDGDAPTACTGGGTTSKGVWYTFTGTGQAVTISTDNAETNFDTEINIYEGPCGSLTCVGGDDNSGTGTTSEYSFTTTIATDYYIYVDGNGSAEGQFEISLTCSTCNANAGTWD